MSRRSSTVTIIEPDGAGRGWSVLARWGAKKRRYGRRAGVVDERTAWAVKLAVEDGIRAGYWWEATRRDARISAVPSLEEMMQAFVDVRAIRGDRDGTIRNVMSALQRFSTWAIAVTGRSDGEALAAVYDEFDEDGLFAFAGWLGRPKPKGAGLAPGSVRQYASRSRRFWEWASRRWRAVVPPAPEFTMRVPREQVIAPRWAQMDHLIARSKVTSPKWVSRLYTIGRCTGLRGGQIARLRWDDFDFEQAVLRVRPELGKTTQERSGRTVPVSRHLLDEMAGWGRREGIVIGSERIIYQTLYRALKLAEIPREVWEHRPTHLCRRGFITGLVQLKADIWAVERLVGHSVASGESAVAADYLDRDAIVERLRPAVDLVPPLGGSALDRARQKKSG